MQMIGLVITVLIYGTLDFAPQMPVVQKWLLRNENIIWTISDLQGLNLADNALTEVPVETLRTLRILSSLDLTNNRVQYVPNNAFVTLRWIMENLLCRTTITFVKD